MSVEECGNCKYYKRNFGECRRYPPVVTDNFINGRQPQTKFTDWCGEWKRGNSK